MECKSMKRPALCILCMIIFFFSVPFAGVCLAAGEDSVKYTNPDTGYRVIIEDDADLLTEMEEEALESDMQGISDYGNVIFKSVYENSSSTEYFAEEYFHDTLGTDSGTLFLVDMDNRYIYIFSDGAIYKVIDESEADTITDNIYKYASNADYYGCASKAYEQIYSILKGEKIARPMKYISNILLAVCLALVLNFMIMRAMTGVKRAKNKELLSVVEKEFRNTEPTAEFVTQSRTYSPPSSSSSGGHSGGGGGHSGGGGGHSF